MPVSRDFKSDPLQGNHLQNSREKFHASEGGGGGACFFTARNYNLAATLTSGQAFRWYPTPDGAWQGIIGRDAVTLRQRENGIEAQASTPNPNWPASHHYLQTEIDIDAITATFPNDAPMQAAIAACRGLVAALSR